MTVAVAERASLADVIATSPARPVGDEVYVLHYDQRPKSVAGDFAIIDDGRETTVVTSSLFRITEARRTDRGMEGPFAAIRLEISDSFGADGFIATATSAVAAAGIGSYLLSTFSYDYLFVAPSRITDALAALAGAGFPLATAG
jgi:hypothetical protein